MKRCNACKEFKTYTGYYKSRESADGRAPTCKACETARKRKAADSERGNVRPACNSFWIDTYQAPPGSESLPEREAVCRDCGEPVELRGLLSGLHYCKTCKMDVDAVYRVKLKVLT